MLSGLACYEPLQPLSCQLVVDGLEALSSANNGDGSCFDYWFKSLETALSGRGIMGSKVGASEDIKRVAGNESLLNEYAVS
jgi:cytokinesis protein